MTLNAALWAGSTALTGKAAFAFWTAALLLYSFDRRKSALVWQILLTNCAIVGCVLGSVYASGPVTQWMWISGALVAGLGAARDVRQWAKTSPREAYEEASKVDLVSKKKKDAGNASRARALKTQPALLLLWLDLLGMSIIAAAIAVSIYTSAPSKTYVWFSVGHILAACMLCGVGVFCAIELTFGSAPSSLSAVSWSGAALVALGCWIVESCIAAIIVLSPIENADDLQAMAMTRLFAISILLIDFVVWIIPHRVATFQRTGKATAWVSLTMAAWIGVVSLALICALPSNWPWSRM